LQAWIGRTETRSDQVTAAPMAALSATLDRDDPPPKPGDPLPPLWHWLYFLPVHRQSELAADGHFHLLDGLGHGSAFGHRPDVVNSCIGEILAATTVTGRERG